MVGLIVNNVTYLDPVSGDLLPNTAVRTENDRVVEVSEGPLSTPAADVAVIDGDGRTMLPGLIDAHIHAVATTLDIHTVVNLPATRMGIEAKAILERMLRRGFTTVRDAGGLDRGGGRRAQTRSYRWPPGVPVRAGDQPDGRAR